MSKLESLLGLLKNSLGPEGEPKYSVHMHVLFLSDIYDFPHASSCSGGGSKLSSMSRRSPASSSLAALDGDEIVGCVSIVPGTSSCSASLSRGPLTSALVASSEGSSAALASMAPSAAAAIGASSVEAGCG